MSEGGIGKTDVGLRDHRKGASTVGVVARKIQAGVEIHRPKHTLGVVISGIERASTYVVKRGHLVKGSAGELEADIAGDGDVRVAAGD